ncbi:MAG: AAA family ATPase [Anaeroplasma sp.]
MIYQRTILNEIIRSIDEYLVTLITGARQVGKSTLASYFEEKGYRYITFDDTELLAKAKENPKKFIKDCAYKSK